MTQTDASGPEGRRLASAASPYLRNHRNDPVAWWPWSEDAFSAAKEAKKPVLLSIGYSACHWCNVMANESFRDDGIAALINEHFVAIKVDREERPDLDAAYQAACSGLGIAGGWPLTLFLTSDGLPFWGGTYFPPEDRGEQPGLSTILAHLASAYEERPDDVTQNAETLKAHVAKSLLTSEPSDIDPAVIDQVATAFMARMDLEHGGITGAPKFPNTPYFERLWRAYLRTGKADFAAAAQLTYTKICQGSMYDHIGGGFARYSTDNEWRVPHFEKMLYDNALILNALCALHGNVPQPLYAQRIAQTVDFLLQDMRQASGPLAAAMSADDLDGEGAFYLWDREDIAASLGPDIGETFCKAYSIEAHGPFGGKSIPHRLDREAFGNPQDEARLMAACEKLRRVREKRPHPMRDEKVLTDWNALAVIAIARAGKLMQRRDWVDAAAQIFQSVMGFRSTEDGLPHSVLEGMRGSDAMLDDYAAMGLAAITLASALDEPTYLTLAQDLADQMSARFASDAGNFYQSVTPTPFGRAILLHDQPIPSGNAMAVRFLFQLSRLIGAPRYEDEALRAVQASGGAMKQNVMATASLLSAYEDMIDPIEVSWSPADYDAETIAWAISPPGALILGPKLRALDSASALAVHDEFKGILLCRDNSCGLPLARREDAIDALRNAKRVATNDAGQSVS